MSKEELIIDSKTLSLNNGLNLFFFIRFVVLTGIVALGIKILIKKISEVRRKVDLIDKIPGPKSFNFLLGNIPLEIIKYVGADYESSKDMYLNLLQAVRGYTEVYKRERIFRIWLGWEPLLILWKPETVETVLSHNFLLDKSSEYNMLHSWLGTGLLTSTGAKWRIRRKMLVPAFHFKILHDFVPVFNEQGWIFVDKLRQISKKGKPVDIVPLITACTLDIICETVMGVRIGAQKNYNNEYCKAVNEVGECFMERLIQPSFWFEPIYYRLSRGKFFRKKLGLLHDFTRKVIRDRKNELLGIQQAERSFEKADKYIGSNGGGENGEPKRKAFMDLLLNVHLNNENELSEEGIREEVDTFMFEGHDTTSVCLSWIFHYLGHHPEVQERLWQEIDPFFEQLQTDITSMSSDEERLQIKLDKLKDLKYLECVIKEGLRLNPSVPFVGRKVHEDMLIKDYKIPKGTIVYCFIYMLHRDPEIFPEPEKFKPERFLPENSQGRHPYAFVPFSAGPRNCIGQRFAFSELKIVLALALRHFKFESVDKFDKIVYNMEMVLRPKVPLKIKIIERDLTNRTPASSMNFFTLDRKE